MAQAVARTMAPPSAARSLGPTEAELASAAARLRALRDRADALSGPRPPLPPRSPASWRDELVRWADATLCPAVAPTLGDAPHIGEELAALVRRLELSPVAQRAVTLLYAAYLAGTPHVPMRVLAGHLGAEGWREALGTGELGALALLRHRDGAVGLRRPVLDALDGRPWRAIRVLGGVASAHPARADLHRVAVAHWPAWFERLGRVALVTGALHRAVLEARLADLVAVTFEPIRSLPAPWPGGARLLVVTDELGGFCDQLPELPPP